MKNKPSLIRLDDIRNQQNQEHANKLKELFEKQPELTYSSIIICPEQGIVLLPESMSIVEAIGVLELQKFELLNSLLEDD